MPFEVFRRHQRKLLTIFAILAMFGFVVSDSLPKLLSPSYAGKDPEVATIFKSTIHRSQLQAIHEERSLANLFVYEVAPFLRDRWFGGTGDRALIDALILEHEADELGIPGGSEQGREFVEVISNHMMNETIFESKLARLNARVTGDQVLTAIGNQLRIKNVQSLMGRPQVTPYDVFQVYRDQNERVSAHAVAIPVETFLTKVAEPSDDEIFAMYEQYKDVLPDPARETPGFKVPRQLQLEILSIDSNALAQGLKDKLTEADLRTAYENHKSEYPMRSELPTDLFAGQPALTPPVLRSFEDVRSTLAARVAEERAQADITQRFGEIKDDVMIPFANDYSTAVDELEQAKKQNPNATAVLPTSPDVKELAERQGINYERTRPLSREEAENYGAISGANVGTRRMSDGRKFAEELYDPKKGLYEPEELTDDIGMRFLVRKIKDIAPHVPDLADIRSEVIGACKMVKARELAEKVALALASELKKKGGPIKEETIQGYRVVAIPATARRQFVYNPARMTEDPIPEESTIPDVPHAGEAFRTAFFGLEPGAVTVAPDQPRKVFYVLSFDRREPATVAGLYADNGDELRYKLSARDVATRQAEGDWMAWLRAKAELRPDWIPPDEQKKKDGGED
jgi:peptidyl-prolyl cis-trans isomerase D